MKLPLVLFDKAIYKLSLDTKTTISVRCVKMTPFKGTVMYDLTLIAVLITIFNLLI